LDYFYRSFVAFPFVSLVISYFLWIALISSAYSLDLQ
jgi:hypothetical protein